MSNRLSKESSPYLLQHAENPVDWYPWGTVALEKARREDKPVFLSIGYSACHWCHVMAHESFEDEIIAGILNEHFVSIKVDREERPDLDRIYMNAVQAMTGQGGWPMSVFLTPEGQPFYGGTYFPPTRRFGMPSFTDVLHAVAQGWRKRRAELLESGQKLTKVLAHQQRSASATSSRPLTKGTLHAAYARIRDRFDDQNGGWGGAPKFPQPMILEFLLRYHAMTGKQDALDMVTRTLEKMARGGIYDQLGGGFHRYSVDARWLVPHFEKMLYDNALLARVYLHAWQVTGMSFFREIVEETLDYVAREMHDPDGGFYSSQDADSEGEEGKFFVWTEDELRDILGAGAAAFFSAYGVSQAGNFEGKNVLEYQGELGQRSSFLRGRRELFGAREKRIQPGRDDKVLTSWNGLMLAAFAEAARALRRDDYRDIAIRSGEFLLKEMRQTDGSLLRTWRKGKSKLNAYLEDYANLTDGLIELYQTTFEPRWYAGARELADIMIERFSADSGGFYDTSRDHESLIVRPREVQDNAVPSGNAMAAVVLQKLAGLSVKPGYRDIALRSLASLQRELAEHPLAFGQWLGALVFALSEPMDIAIVGSVDARNTRALLAAALEGYRPFHVLAWGSDGPSDSLVPLLRNRTPVDGSAAAYVCRDSTCKKPTTLVEEFEQLLAPPRN